MSFLPTSTACSAHHPAGLLHPAADHGVRPVSRLERPTGGGTWGSAMPSAVLPPRIFSQGRTTLRSFLPCTQPSYACGATEIAPSPFVDARLTDSSAPLRATRSLWATKARIRAVHGRASPLAVAAPPLLTASAESLSSRHPRRAWRNHSTSGSSSTYRSVAPARRCRPAGARCFHGLSALHTPSSRTVLPPKRPHLRRGVRSTSCSGSAASPASRSGATRGRRDAGHRAPRSVAGRRRGPEGKGSGPERPSEDGTRERSHPSENPPRAS